jgi:hypothetical protein
MDRPDLPNLAEIFSRKPPICRPRARFVRRLATEGETGAQAPGFLVLGHRPVMPSVLRSAAVIRVRVLPSPSIGVRCSQQGEW